MWYLLHIFVYYRKYSLGKWVIRRTARKGDFRGHIVTKFERMWFTRNITMQIFFWKVKRQWFRGSVLQNIAYVGYVSSLLLDISMHTIIYDLLFLIYDCLMHLQNFMKVYEYYYE